MKKQYKFIAIIIPVIVILVIIMTFILKSKQQAGIKILNGNISLSSDTGDYQSCWATDSHNFARAENGYYFMADNGKSLMYFDMDTKNVIPVCAKPDCRHDDYECNSYLGNGEYLLFGVYYYRGYIYMLKNNMGNAELVQISSDGATRREIADVFPTDGGNSLDVVFNDNKAYIYDHCGNFLDANSNKESEVSIQEVDLKSGTVKKAYSIIDTNVSFNHAKNYGNKLFFLMRKSREKIGTDEKSASRIMETKGLYAYDYYSGIVETVMEGNICDYSIDEANGTIYYFESGKGLYKCNINNDTNSILLYKAEKDCMQCTMSYDGRYIYLNNTDWAASSTGGKGMSCRIFDTDGILINRIDNPWNGYGEIYFGDDKYMFSTFADYDESGKPTGTMFWYLPKEDVAMSKEWIRLTEKPIQLIDELELRKRMK